MASPPGYSLLELLVVLAIIALISTIAVPAASTSLDRMTLAADVRSLATQLRDLRETALDQQVEIAVSAQVHANSPTASNGVTLTISAGTALEADADGFKISADGIPSGSLRVSRGNASVRIATQPLTGRIMVEAAP